MNANPQENSVQEKILVIKLGAFGDFIQALGPMAAIRKHHPEGHIRLLTTAPFKKFGENCGYFDSVEIDERPKIYNIGGILKLRSKLNQSGYSRIYDLQNNDRTALYFRLLDKRNKPEWVGTAKGASHRNMSPERTKGQSFEGHVQTLALAGIQDIKIDDLSWINNEFRHPDVKDSYVLLVPGSAPQHPEKRWPAASYAALASYLIDRRYQVIVLGTAAEKEVTDIIQSQEPRILNLTGQTSLTDIALLARHAKAAIGNDTGPMHMIAPTGCPALILFSAHSNPVRHAPKGDVVETLQENDLKELSVEAVTSCLEKTVLKK